MKRVLILWLAVLMVIGAGVLAAQTAKSKDAPPPKDAPKVYEVSDEGITAPRLLEAATPGYTEEAKKKKIEGEVVISAVIDDKGDPVDLKVKKSLDKGLDASAIEATKLFKYKPGEKDGATVRVRMDIPFTFYLTKD